MRLGGPVLEDYENPDQWVAALRRLGYRAAYCPVDEAQPDAVVRAYATAADEADIIIAEVGAWSNPLGPDEGARRAALSLCQRRLALADAIGARCCVNITGSRGERWDGPHPDNLTPDTFALIVDTVRAIVDAVRPTRAFYALETMPWMYPDSPESYLELIRAIDRPRVAVHLDPVNLVCSPQRFYANGTLIHACFDALGPLVKSCHAKDIVLDGRLTVHLDEVRPGVGHLDYRTYLRCLEALPRDTPLMLEHLATAEEYAAGAAYIRSVAQEIGVLLA